MFYRLRVISAAGIFMLAGCGGTAEQQAKEVIENTLSREKQTANIQSSMTDLEAKEQSLFKELMKIDADDADKMKEIAKEGKENVKERQQKMNEERQAMDQAAEEFAQLKKIVPDNGNSDLKKQMLQMQKTMEARYKAHKEISKLYAEITETNIRLYHSLQTKNAKLNQIKNDIAKVNETNKKLHIAHEKFNKHTKAFNNQKKVLYTEE